MSTNLNTTMHRIWPVDESDLDMRQAERDAFVPHECPRKPIGSAEKIGHRLVAATCIAGLVALGFMAQAGMLPGGVQ